MSKTLSSDKHPERNNFRFRNFFYNRNHFFRLLNNSDNLSIIGIIIPLVTLVIIGYIVYQIISTFISHIKVLESTVTLSPMLERLLLYLVDAETGQRGYLITGNTNYLQLYDTSLSNIDDQVQNLIEVTANNQSQQSIITEEVIPLINEHLRILDQSININGGGLNVPSALNETSLIDEGKMNMDNIRTIIQTLESDQNEFLKNRSQALEFESNSLLNRILILILGIFIITAITIFTINHKIKNRDLETKRKLEYEITENTKEIRESNIKLKSLNEQLVNHDKLQKDFINIAAHELRTPCQAIAGYSELALQDENYRAVDSKYGQFITSINQNVFRLQDLVEKILDVAKIESNNLVVKINETDIVVEFKNILKEFGKVIENNDNKMIVMHTPGSKNASSRKYVKINLLVTPHSIIVKIDKTRFYQVMTNLLNNAIKASLDNFENIKGDPLITISIEIRNYYDVKLECKEILDTDSNQFIFVSITDSGKGIPEKISTNLFSKFVSFTEKGMGLGLFISKSIIEKHGGIMWAHNSHLKGKGATFKFIIPYDPQINMDKNSQIDQ
jgi:signal transduction histidine kinase